jgi:hypothetical protein
MWLVKWENRARIRLGYVGGGGDWGESVLRVGLGTSRDGERRESLLASLESVRLRISV